MFGDEGVTSREKGIDLTDLGLPSALRRTFHQGLQGLVLYCVPFLIVGSTVRALTLAVDRYAGRSAVWIDVALIYFICYPENFLAEIFVASAYLKEGSVASRPFSSEAFHLIFRPNAASLIARLILRCVAWLIPLLGFFLAEFVVVLIAMKFTHWGDPPHISKTVNHALIELAFVFYAGVCSRYSFVVPLYVFREAWQNDALVDGVRFAKQHWRLLWVLAMATSGVLFVAHDLSKWVVAVAHGSRLLDRSTQLLQLLLGSIVAGYFSVLKAELMRRSVSAARNT